MIILITYKDEKGTVMVSHGVDSETFKNVVMLVAPLSYYKPKFDSEMGEYYVE